MPEATFATVEQIAARLGRTFEGTQLATVQALAEDATGHLQALIGQQVLPATSTAVLYVDAGEQWIPLPQMPVREVLAVLAGPVGFERPVTGFELIDQQLHVGYGFGAGPNAEVLAGVRDRNRWGHTRLLVTFTHGLVDVPADLRSWTVVLVSQALAHLAQGGALGSAGLQSERIDDYAVNFATTGAGSEAFHVPALAGEQLRARYGAGAYITGHR